MNQCFVFLIGGFNTVLIIVIFSYVGTFIGRFLLEYKKDQREEQQMYWNHQYKMMELGMKKNATLIDDLGIDLSRFLNFLVFSQDSFSYSFYTRILPGKTDLDLLSRFLCSCFLAWFLFFLEFLSDSFFLYFLSASFFLEILSWFLFFSWIWRVYYKKINY